MNTARNTVLNRAREVLIVTDLSVHGTSLYVFSIAVDMFVITGCLYRN
jgi:hypothetical protein